LYDTSTIVYEIVVDTCTIVSYNLLTNAMHMAIAIEQQGVRGMDSIENREPPIHWNRVWLGLLILLLSTSVAIGFGYGVYKIVLTAGVL
jgi:hypothetical protein